MAKNDLSDFQKQWNKDHRGVYIAWSCFSAILGIATGAILACVLSALLFEGRANVSWIFFGILGPVVALWFYTLTWRGFHRV